MTISETVPLQASRPGRQFLLPGLAAVLVVAADYFLFDQPIGIGWFVFLVLLALAMSLSRWRQASVRRLVLAGIIPLLALPPLAENVSPLSVVVALMGLAAFALVLNRQLRTGLAAVARQLVGFFLLAPSRLPADMIRSRAMDRKLGRKGAIAAQVLVWTVPAIFGAAFIFLFSLANPIIEHWLMRIDIWAFLVRIDIWRVAFWVLAAAGVWAYLRPRLPRWRRRSKPAPLAAPQTVTTPPPTLAIALFGRPALLRALLVFNAIFAVQTGLDAAYLWGGVTLPDNMSYAAYAHRGAYALIATALLAAAFVLAAMRPGSATAGDRLIRGLVYLWTAQNIWLVASSILRLDLYVGVYSLTYWRVAAFLWMVLVAAGLALIVARIALGKSNEWLMSANLATLAAMLYACCFVNFAALIANYNVDHSREMTGQGLAIDQTYLRELGPAAFPAIDRLMARAWNNEVLCAYDYDVSEPVCIEQSRSADEAAFRAASTNWRAWSFRNWRVMRYLEARAAGIPVTPARPEVTQ